MKSNTWSNYIRPDKNPPPAIRFGSRAVLILAAISAWVVFGGDIIPGPLAIAASFPGLWRQGEMLDALSTSIALDLQAIAALSFFSLVIGYASITPIGRELAGGISNIRFNGFVGIPLLFTLIVGNPHAVKVALLVWGSIGFTVPGIVDVIKGIPQEEFDYAYALRFGRWRAVWEVVILGTRHEVIDVLMTNFGMIWFLVPMVEALFRYEGGVGPLMLDFNKHMQLELVYALTIVVLGFGFVQDYVIGLIRDVVCPYATREHSK